MSILIWSVFETGEGARKGVEALIEASFPPDEIRVVMKSKEGLEDVPLTHRTAVPAAAAAGATLGAAGAAGAVLLTGGGALLAAGPLAALLQAAGLGAAFGGIAGAFGGLGWWKDEPDIPAAVDEEPGARVLVLIPIPEGRESEARSALSGAGALRVGTAGAEAAARAHISDALADDVQQKEGQDRRQGNAQ